MVNDFEWAVLIPPPRLREGAKFIIDKNSITNDGDRPMFVGRIVFVVESFGISSELCSLHRYDCSKIDCSCDNTGKEVMNFQIIDNTTDDCEDRYPVGYHGEINLDDAERLVEQEYWQVYDEEI